MVIRNTVNEDIPRLLEIFAAARIFMCNTGNPNQCMKFVGAAIVYAYLEAIGILNTHEIGCFLHKKL